MWVCHVLVVCLLILPLFPFPFLFFSLNGEAAELALVAPRGETTYRILIGRTTGFRTLLSYRSGSTTLVKYSNLRAPLC